MATARISEYRPGLVDLAAGQISREIFVNDEIGKSRRDPPPLGAVHEGAELERVRDLGAGALAARAHRGCGLNRAPAPGGRRRQGGARRYALEKQQRSRN